MTTVNLFGKRSALACALLASVSIFSCEEIKLSRSVPVPEIKFPNHQKVFVVFEGPWALVADSKDANSILAIAMKTRGHRDLYVAASNDSTLAAGSYELSVPPHGPATSSALNASFAQSKISAANLQHAIDNKSGRYVVRLPAPEAYLAARRTRSRVGSTYPPDASTEQDYATEASLLYTVDTLTGFSLAGSPDSGNFNPILLQVETPTIRFSIEPAQSDDLKDRCNTHSREGFRDETQSLGLKLYLDFPGDPASCYSSDPQSSRSAQSEPAPEPDGAIALPASKTLATMFKALVGFKPLARNQPFATIDASKLAPRLFNAIYIFHSLFSDCKIPILMLTVAT
jgi:hypothetical protein